LPGTDLAVGNSPCGEEACDDGDGFGFACVVSLRPTRGAALDDGLETLLLSGRGGCRDAEANSGDGTG